MSFCVINAATVFLSEVHLTFIYNLLNGTQKNRTCETLGSMKISSIVKETFDLQTILTVL